MRTVAADFVFMEFFHQRLLTETIFHDCPHFKFSVLCVAEMSVETAVLRRHAPDPKPSFAKDLLGAPGGLKYWVAHSHLLFAH